jgi:toxin secretion/phage lysis holin
MLSTLISGIDLSKFVLNPLYFIMTLITLDVLTGLLASAKERKLNSKVNFNGMIKKVAELLLLVFITLIDTYFKANGEVIKMGTWMIIIYEATSIIENFKRVGWDISILTKYFDQGKDENK